MGERVIMSREILFKAKRKDWEELPKDQWWVEGDLLHMRYGDIVLINNFEDQLFRCDGNMVCQFTGLHDNTKWGDLTEAEKELFLSDWNYREDRKNKIEDWSGRKIWENDIVECNKRKEECGLYKVIWRKEYADFGVVPISNTCIGQYPIGFSYGKTLHGRDYKLVGNIFDNHELLEVEK